jgi:hypothetical protein
VRIPLHPPSKFFAQTSKAPDDPQTSDLKHDHLIGGRGFAAATCPASMLRRRVWVIAFNPRPEMRRDPAFEAKNPSPPRS